MSRLDIKTPSKAQMVVEHLYRSMEHRIEASPPGLCPIDMALNFLNLCHAQTCGKCVPCRVGLGQLSDLLHEVLDGRPSLDILQLIEDTAEVIVASADCAIGVNAAQLVLTGLHGFRDDYEEHILRHRCLGSLKNPVPCVALCPAGVDIPGYISLVGEERYADAIRLIRKMDKQRRKYYESYTHKTWGAPEGYDLYLDTGALSTADAAAVIAERFRKL
mgnify:CR=1 FL=1